MKTKKATAYILAVLPLALLAAGFALEIIFNVCVRIDPIYWREHYISLISAALLILYPFYTLPCVIIAKTMNRELESGFVTVFTWLDIFAVVIPILYYVVR